MWYQVKEIETGEEIGTAHNTLAAALTYCKQLGGDLEIQTTDTLKVCAVISEGVFIGGTPNALRACYERGVNVEICDEGR